MYLMIGTGDFVTAYETFLSDVGDRYYRNGILSRGFCYT